MLNNSDLVCYSEH